MSDGAFLRAVEVRAAVYALAELDRGRRFRGLGVPRECAMLLRRLNTPLTASRSRQPSGGQNVESSLARNEIRVGTRWVADRLGWSTRRVQRHAAELGGERVGTGYVFAQNAIEEYAQEVSP